MKIANHGVRRLLEVALSLRYSPVVIEFMTNVWLRRSGFIAPLQGTRNGIQQDIGGCRSTSGRPSCREGIGAGIACGYRRGVASGGSLGRDRHILFVAEYLAADGNAH